MSQAIRFTTSACIKGFPSNRFIQQPERFDALIPSPF